MRKRREVDYGYDGPSIGNWNSTKDRLDYNGIVSVESGPSRITIDDLERMESGHRSHSSSTLAHSLPRRQTRRKPIVFGIALALLPLVSAAPPIYRPDSPVIASIPTPTPTRLYPRQSQSPTSTSTEPESRIDGEEIDYDIQYLTSMSTPTHALPTNAYVVAETRLPYYLSQAQDGSWTKVDNAWLLYGRQAGLATAVFGPDEDPIATAVPTSMTSDASQFAITDALPPGWGIEATRSEFYRTPLIVAMSVILALMIVAGIIFIVIKRRKQHRRAKRRAARMRRKALAAAGLTEDDINNRGDSIDSALREKLAKIEGTTVPKKKKERGPTSVIRTKVRTWNQGVLRRRHQEVGLGSSRSHTPSIEIIQEDKPDVDPNATVVLSASQSNDTNRSIPTDASRTSNERGGTSGSPDDTTDSTNTNDTNSTAFTRSNTQPPTATYFPPAYRPASVRSLQVNMPSGPSTSAGPSTQAGQGQSSRSVPVVEKTTAPGYYPAPATEDSEVALAVASRSDGKQRMDAPPSDEEEDQRVRHIATDDKLVLERMRLGGSAPSAPPELDQQDGPSAPIVEVDEQGFEVPSESALAHDPTILAPAISEGSSVLPEPPRQRPMASRVYSQADLAETLELDESHLLPSAPPPAHEDHLVPSAPPLSMPDEDEAGSQSPSAPSAPMFEIGGEDDEEAPGTASTPTRESTEAFPTQTHQENVAGPSSDHLDLNGIESDHHRKPSLPTYEP